MSFLTRILGLSRVELTQRLGAYPLANGDISPLYVFFGVENTGRDEIELASVSVTVKRNSERLAVELKGEVPVRIAPGEDVRYEVRAKDLAVAANDAGHSGTPKLSFVATDGDGIEHRHDFKLRVDEYLALKDE